MSNSEHTHTEPTENKLPARGINGINLSLSSEMKTTRMSERRAATCDAESAGGVVLHENETDG